MKNIIVTVFSNPVRTFRIFNDNSIQTFNLAATTFNIQQDKFIEVVNVNDLLELFNWLDIRNIFIVNVLKNTNLKKEEVSIIHSSKDSFLWSNKILYI